MQKFINKAENLTQEMLEGLALAHPEFITLAQGNLVVNKNLAAAERVAIVTLGGTGHEPALSGFVGEGMADIAVCGDVFAAPGPQAVLDALQLADRGQGVLLIVGNHTGTVLSADIACKQARKMGLQVEQVLVSDNVGDAEREQLAERRGMLGWVALCKIAGGAAVAGKTLAEMAALARKFAGEMATLAVTARAGTNPTTGKALAADIPAGKLRMGVGELGDGGEEIALPTADGLAKLLVARLACDLQLQADDKVLLMVSGSCATTLMEQLIVFRSCCKLLAEQGIAVVARKAGNLLTAADTCGLQVCVARMDDELLECWNAPCKTPYYKN